MSLRRALDAREALGLKGSVRRSILESIDAHRDGPSSNRPLTADLDQMDEPTADHDYSPSSGGKSGLPWFYEIHERPDGYWLNIVLPVGPYKSFEAANSASFDHARGQEKAS